MLEKISDIPQREKARDRINYTLNILDQETISEEAVALIISETPLKPICPKCGNNSIVYSSFGDRTGKNCKICDYSALLVD